MSADRDALHLLKARYCRYTDMKMWSEWGQLFTADALLRFPEGMGIHTELAGRSEIVATVSKALSAMTTCHHCHMPELQIGRDESRGIWAMEDWIWIPDGGLLHGFGHYHEHYVRDDGEWRFAEVELRRLHVGFS